MNDAYEDINHCIHCDMKGFENFEAVLEHIRETHNKPGDNLPDLNGYD